MKNFQIALAILFVAGATSAQAAVTCMEVYVTSDTYCYETSLKGSYGWRCNVVPRYETQCFGSYDPEPMPPTQPVPYYVDAAYIYAQSVDDSDLQSLAVRFSAASQFDNFAAYVDGVPYSHDAGAVQVLGGIPTSALAMRTGSSNKITIEACASQQGYCAVATVNVNVYTQPPKTASSVLTAFYVPLEAVTYGHDVSAEYNERVYSVTNTPGNTRYIFLRMLSSFTFNKYTTTNRSETAKWRFSPNMFYAESAAMRETHRDSLLGINDAVEHMTAGFAWLSGSDGLFEGEVTHISRQAAEGLQFPTQILDTKVQVEVP